MKKIILATAVLGLMLSACTQNTDEQIQDNRKPASEVELVGFNAAPWTLPQPVGIIGTYAADGTPNAMNAAWVGQYAGDKVCISLSSHATTDNINLNGAFTLGFASAETVVAADYVGIESAKTTPDKIARAGWTAVRSEVVNAPVFKDLPLTLECTVVAKLDETEKGGYVLIGKIEHIVAREDVLTDGKPDMDKMHIISYSGIDHSYRLVGKKVGQAFNDGAQLR